MVRRTQRKFDPRKKVTGLVDDTLYDKLAEFAANNDLKDGVQGAISVLLQQSFLESEEEQGQEPVNASVGKDTVNPANISSLELTELKDKLTQIEESFASLSKTIDMQNQSLTKEKENFRKTSNDLNQKLQSLESELSGLKKDRARIDQFSEIFNIGSNLVKSISNALESNRQNEATSQPEIKDSKISEILRSSTKKTRETVVEKELEKSEVATQEVIKKESKKPQREDKGGTYSIDFLTERFETTKFVLNTKIGKKDFSSWAKKQDPEGISWSMVGKNIFEPSKKISLKKRVSKVDHKSIAKPAITEVEKSEFKKVVAKSKAVAKSKTAEKPTKKRAPRTVWTLDHMKKIAAERNGVCLSRKYESITKKLTWACAVENCNHTWEAAPHNVIYNKSWCPKCAAMKKAGHLEKARSAKKRK